MSRTFALFVVGVLAASARAQTDTPQARKDDVPWVKLTLTPQAAPKPALRYPLLPELRDLKSGNAALPYQRAHSPDAFSAFRRHPDYDAFPEWLELPLEKFPHDKVRSMLPKFTLDEIDSGARRSYCDWEQLERLRKDGLAMLVPDVQGFREYAMLLHLRARMHVADGDFDKAVYGLQSGYALGRHVGDAPTLIQALVGVAITGMMNKQVEELIQQPGAPNLYWALTDLPRPMIDMRRPLQGERIMVEALLPGLHELLRDAKSRALSREEIIGYLDRIAPLVNTKGTDMRLSAAVVSAMMHPQGRKFLIAQGRKAEDVDAMPVVQVGLLYAAGIYEERFDELRKWQSFPYFHAHEAMVRMDKEFLDAARGEGANFATIFGNLMLPAVAKVLLASQRLERQIAALRCVEALRLHAAANGGKLPTQLAEIREAPIPIDPITGKAFTYKRDGDKAYLSTPPSPGEVAYEGNVIRYEITLRARKD